MLISTKIQKLSQESFFFKWLLSENISDMVVSESVVDVGNCSNFEVQQQKQVTSSQIQVNMQENEKDRKMSRIRNDRKRETEKIQKIQKDKTFNIKTQKKNRNVLSNLVHHLLKYLNFRNYTETLVGRIIQVHHLNLNTMECFILFEQIAEEFKGYVTENNICNLWTAKFQENIYQLNHNKKKDFAKLIRILSANFYRSECISSITLSNKLSRESKLLHYKGLNDICQLLFSLSTYSSGKLK